MEKILVTGGAGYIGSFMVRRLLEEQNVVVVDSLEKGYEDAISSKARFIKGDIGDTNFLNALFEEEKISCVIHFAGYISMGESMESPGKYFINNTENTVKLLDAMVSHNIKSFIFSSTAGVYGNPEKTPIPEDHPKNPTNPYGESKLMVENVLKWYKKVYGMRFVSLRYFNAAGASLNGDLGERHDPETHLIPSAIHAALSKKPFSLFGDDYNTPDKTCIRDYIHVLDLVEAHVLALQEILKKDIGDSYNVGTGKGYSNKEVLDVIKKISGIDFEVTVRDRRPGDAEILVADPTKIQNDLGFSPKYSEIEQIVKSAWEWHKNGSASSLSTPLKVKVQSSE